MPNVGPMEIAVIAVIVLVIFGPRRLPELGRGMGTGMREFKDGITGKQRADQPAVPARDSSLPEAAAVQGASAERTD